MIQLHLNLMLLDYFPSGFSPRADGGALGITISEGHGFPLHIVIVIDAEKSVCGGDRTGERTDLLLSFNPFLLVASQ